jgi:hypothetical protein
MKMNGSRQVGENFVKHFVVVPFRVHSAHFQISLQQQRLLDHLVIVMATQDRVCYFENFQDVRYVDSGGLCGCDHVSSMTDMWKLSYLRAQWQRLRRDLLVDETHFGIGDGGPWREAGTIEGTECIGRECVGMTLFFTHISLHHCEQNSTLGLPHLVVGLECS